MINIILILLGKTITIFSRTFNFGHGSTWPGHIALNLNKNFIKDVLKKNQVYSSSEAKAESRSPSTGSGLKSSRQARTIKNGLQIILIAGTNGKTTTGKLIQTILEKNGHKVFQNESGANLLNGIASSLLLHSSILSSINYDYAIFEIDENTLPHVLKEITPEYLILLNLFRDQLDRYGEINSVAKKWDTALQKITPSTTIILNADDPQIAYMGKHLQNVILGTNEERTPESDSGRASLARMTSARVLYFGINNRSLAQKEVSLHADSIYCPNCSAKLTFNPVYFSHLGIWNCTKCKEKRPTPDISNFSYFPIPGVYNIYNTLAAVLLAKTVGIAQPQIITALKSFSPAFGRQETLDVDGRKFRLFLSKNPTSFTESLRTIKDLNAKELLIVLNDRIPDGLDVSWIWDVNFEEFLTSTMRVHVSGDRCWDMSVRLKYAHPVINHVDTHERLDFSLKDMMNRMPNGETLYVLPTYSAMLEVRKILTGKKIL